MLSAKGIDTFLSILTQTTRILHDYHFIEVLSIWVSKYYKYFID